MRHSEQACQQFLSVSREVAEGVIIRRGGYAEGDMIVGGAFAEGDMIVGGGVAMGSKVVVGDDAIVGGGMIVAVDYHAAQELANVIGADCRAKHGSAPDNVVVDE